MVRLTHIEVILFYDGDRLGGGKLWLIRFLGYKLERSEQCLCAYDWVLYQQLVLMLFVLSAALLAMPLQHAFILF